MALESWKQPHPSVIEQQGAAGMGDLQASEADLAELSKALDTGDYTTAVAGTTDGAALRVQSLEGTLKVLTFQEKHAVLWKNIAKVPAYSTIEEYDELNSYGTEGSAFIPQGYAPVEDDSTYTRRASYVKYMGTLRKVTHPMTLVRTVAGDIIARENTNGTLKIIRDVENALFWGDSTRVFTGEGLEFNGLDKLIGTNTYDLNGSDLTEGAIEDAAEIVADGYGNPTDLYLSNKLNTAFTKTMIPKGRMIYPAPGGQGQLRAGVFVNEVATAHGVIAINPSRFLNTGRSAKVSPPATATSTLAPTAPTSVAASSMTGATGKWRSSQVGTAITFKVTACNRFGESAPCAAGGTTTVTSSDLAKYIPLTITNNTVVIAPEWFNIYASDPTGNGSSWYLIGMVAASSQANGGTTTYNYTGETMANTSTAFIGEMSPDVVAFKQLAPLMKMDLAVIDPSIRWMILLYGVLQMYAPKKWVKMINVGLTSAQSTAN